MGPLDGVRVLDLSKYGPPRYCSMILGDLGADVIVVEMPRTAGQNLDIVTDDVGYIYIGASRSKRSIAINLKKEEGKDILRRLVEKSDVLMESNRPGVMKKRGMDYESLSRVNPRLIYCSMTGYGQDGPYSQRTGHEINFSAVSGIMGLTGSRNGPPVYLQSPIVADYLGGVTQAVIAIVAALFAREKIGKGQYIDVSITDGAVFYHCLDGQKYLLDGRVPERPEWPSGTDMACYNVYTAKDGKYFTVACPEPWLWEKLCGLVGREDFVPSQFDPIDKQTEMYGVLSEVFATKDRDEWVRILEEADISVAPVYDFKEMFSDPHFVQRGIAVEVDHPKLGKLKLLNTPFKFSETPAEVRGRPPLWAENTREVLSQLLGLSNEELDRLVREEVVE